MFNKFELFSFGFAIVAMASALYLLQMQFSGLSVPRAADQSAASGLVVVGDGDELTARATALQSASTNRGVLTKLVIDDIRIGAGEVVAIGDTVSVHYIGTLQNGQEFDNSRKRGTPFEFTVGSGRVIAGWEEGIVGMQVGGQRILVVPASMAYGNETVGPIPPNSTLVFIVELLAIK